MQIAKKESKEFFRILLIEFFINRYLLCFHFQYNNGLCNRLIHSLFPQDPEFKGRRVVTFHNQRDFIFFRHYRYISVKHTILPLLQNISNFHFPDIVLPLTILKCTFLKHKELKRAESKGKKDKDDKSDDVPEQKTIARLQVGICSFLFSF